MSVVQLFLQDKIIINDKEYGRMDFSKIAADNKCQIKDHPFDQTLKSIEITNVTINTAECGLVMIEAADGKIMNVVLYLRGPIAPWLAACSCCAKGSPDIYETPYGKFADYIFDDFHKITVIMKDNCLIYLWDCN